MRHSNRGINCEGSEGKGTRRGEEEEEEKKDTIEAEYNILDCLQMLRRDWRLF